jgi:plastocyanin
VRRPLFVLGLVIALAVALVACGDDDDDAAAPAATTAAGAATNTTAAAAGGGASATTAGGGAAAGAQTTEVIKNLSFTTTEVHVAVGGTVVFDNQDSTTHTATADDGSFDTGHIDAGKQKSVSFPKAGSFAFHCSIHPFMKATLVVA